LKPYILIGGDVVPCTLMEQRYTENNLFCSKLKDVIENTENFYVNLEAPLTDTKKNIFKSGPSLKSKPSMIDTIKGIGVTGVFLANNHIMDYGSEGLTDTIKACRENNITTVGADKNKELAQKPVYIDVGSKTVAIINIAENEFGSATPDQPGISTFDTFQNIRTLKETRKKCDILIVSLHAGLEYFPLPRPGLRDLCQFLIEEGADAIICHHTHITSAYEVINNKPIFYGVGNFIFNAKNKSPSWNQGFLVKIFIDDDDLLTPNFEIVPYSQDIEQAGVRALEMEELTIFHDNLENLNKTLKDESRYIKLWKDLCLKKSEEYMNTMYFPIKPCRLKILRLIPWLRKLIHPSYRRAIRLNLLRCESHMEVIKLIHENAYTQELEKSIKK